MNGWIWKYTFYNAPVNTPTIMCQHPDTVTLRQTRVYVNICHRPHRPKWVNAASTSIVIIAIQTKSTSQNIELSGEICVIQSYRLMISGVWHKGGLCKKNIVCCITVIFGRTVVCGIKNMSFKLNDP